MVNHFSLDMIYFLELKKNVPRLNDIILIFSPHQQTKNFIIFEMADLMVATMKIVAKRCQNLVKVLGNLNVMFILKPFLLETIQMLESMIGQEIKIRCSEKVILKNHVN